MHSGCSNETVRYARSRGHSRRRPQTLVNRLNIVIETAAQERPRDDVLECARAQSLCVWGFLQIETTGLTPEEVARDIEASLNECGPIVDEALRPMVMEAIND